MNRTSFWLTDALSNMQKKKKKITKQGLRLEITATNTTLFEL